MATWSHCCSTRCRTVEHPPPPPPIPVKGSLLAVYIKADVSILHLSAYRRWVLQFTFKCCEYCHVWHHKLTLQWLPDMLGIFSALSAWVKNESVSLHPSIMTIHHPFKLIFACPFLILATIPLFHFMLSIFYETYEAHNEPEGH